MEEEEEEGEKGLCFPGNRLGVFPTPIGSQPVGISLLPTKPEDASVSSLPPSHATLGQNNSLRFHH